MERSSLEFLFGKTTTTAKIVEEVPPEQVIPFKIPMKIVERVTNNRYVGDGTVPPGDHSLFALKRMGPLAAIIITAFYLLVFYLSVISKKPKNLSASVYSETFTETPCQHLLLLVGFDTLIYRKYYDTPPILVGHHRALRRA